jgi:hypothetical protein
MKIKTKFESFSDGVCDIYVKYDEEKEDIHTNIRFGNHVLGYKRYWAAAVHNVQINRIIRIPYLPDIDTDCLVSIKGDGNYEIKMVQVKFDANPKCIELTLQRLGGATS